MFPRRVLGLPGGGPRRCPGAGPGPTGDRPRASLRFRGPLAPRLGPAAGARGGFLLTTQPPNPFFSSSGGGRMLLALECHQTW